MFVLARGINEVYPILDWCIKLDKTAVVISANARDLLELNLEFYNYSKIKLINSTIIDHDIARATRPDCTIIIKFQDIEKEYLEAIYLGYAAISSNPIQRVKEQNNGES